MTDKTLEATYISIATSYIESSVPDNEAVFINGVGYGLNLRESEMEDLKKQILDLKAQLIQ